MTETIIKYPVSEPRRKVCSLTYGEWFIDDNGDLFVVHYRDTDKAIGISVKNGTKRVFGLDITVRVVGRVEIQLFW